MKYGNLNVKERLYFRKASKLSVHVVYFITVEKVAVSAWSPPSRAVGAGAPCSSPYSEPAQRLPAQKSINESPSSTINQSITVAPSLLRAGSKAACTVINQWGAQWYHK
jgi:hypothetical protein